MSEDTPSEASGDSPFQLEPTAPHKAGFEALSNTNGFLFWWASDLASLLGYESLQGFRKSIEKAMAALMSLNIPVMDNIIQTSRDVAGKTVQDYKLSRFACYLAAMNGDPKKPQVAQAQVYFARWAEACQMSLEQADGVERVAIRGEVSEHERALSGIAAVSGVTNYPFFQNAGYRGLYNMDLWKIRQRKGIPDGRSPLEFMGKTELAANLFRVTQTEDKIKAEKIRGQANLENAAENVGREVRQAIVKIGGTPPEHLAPAEDIKSVQKRLKSSHREIKKIDGPKK